jgi:hypothetical protein
MFPKKLKLKRTELFGQRRVYNIQYTAKNLPGTGQGTGMIRMGGGADNGK